jgi:hypothetical protein
VSSWVAPGGTLLIVGHLHTQDFTHTHDSTEHENHGQHPPAEASVAVADISAVLDDTLWKIVTAEEQLRTLTGPAGQAVDLRDVVVQATRRT